MTHRKVPPSVRVVETCATCRFVFVRHEHDEPVERFCQKDAPPRPMSMCLAQDDYVGSEDPTFHERWRQWRGWSGSREVQPNEVCDEFEKMEEE